MSYIKFLIVFWLLIWPGPMFWVAIIFESRILPVWEKQSRAFIPGDFTIGPMVLAVRLLWEKGYGPATSVTWIWSPWRIPIIMAVVVYVFFQVRKGDAGVYEHERQIFSPTKILHDVAGYIIIPSYLATFGALVLFRWKNGFPWIAGITMQWETLLFVIALGIYVACVIWDGKVYGPNPSDEIKCSRHDPGWAPIWKTKSLVWGWSGRIRN